MVGLRGFARGGRTEPAKVRRQEVWQAWMDDLGRGGERVGGCEGRDGRKVAVVKTLRRVWKNATLRPQKRYVAFS